MAKGSGRKIGRAKKTSWYKVYNAENRQAKNKQLKILRHQLKHPNDKGGKPLVSSTKKVDPVELRWRHYLRGII